MAHVIGGIFESMGNNVKYLHTDSQAVYESIRIGDVDISHEIWELSLGKSFTTALDKGGLLDWGDHEAKTREDMGYPNWVAEQGLCPGLPDWTALKNSYSAKNFVTPDSGGKGRMLEGPQSWHGDLMPQRIDALGLRDLWVVEFAESGAALWAALKAAEKEGRGTIIFNWTPNFTDAAGFTFIDFPLHTAGCRPDDGGDGKCGSPVGYLKKAVNKNWTKSHPAAAAMFKKLSFSTSQIGEMAALVDLEKMTHEDAAKKWLKDNKKVWERFTK
uniref:ABC-type glycine betaine transport system substrate-binding domain-containing protein n=1 Tax=viral metagenome TaxID=1070528 RepID=A0A6C0EMU8_9ZZZZ